MADRPPVHTKMAQVLPAEFKNGRFCKRNSKRHILKMVSREHSKMIKREHLTTHEANLFLSEVHFFGIKFLEILQRVCYR